jgi:hypothetical protein
MQRRQLKGEWRKRWMGVWETGQDFERTGQRIPSAVRDHSHGLEGRTVETTASGAL